MRKTVAINILNFALLDSSSRFHNWYRFTEIETKKELTDIAEIQFMELPALRRYIQENKTNLQETIRHNKLIEWLLFIDNPESEFTKMVETNNEAIGRAMDMLKTLSKSEKLQEEYMARQKAIMDKYSALSVAEERGIEEGELLKALKTSKRMIKDGIPLNVISKYTELTIEELEKLTKEIESS